MDLKKNYYVYAYLRSSDSSNGKSGSPYYIGKGKRNRASHCHRLHGIQLPKNKECVVFIAKNLVEPDAHQLEIFLIHLHGRIDLGTGCLRNKTRGGEGASGTVLSEETKNRISLAKLGEKHSPERIENNRLAQLGKKLSEEHKQKLREASTGRRLSLESRQKISLRLRGLKRSEIARKNNSDAQKGKKMSKEAKAKISAAMRIRVVSAETKEKLSNSKKGTKHSPETIQKFIQIRSTPEFKKKVHLAKQRERIRRSALAMISSN